MFHLPSFFRAATRCARRYARRVAVCASGLFVACLPVAAPAQSLVGGCPEGLPVAGFLSDREAGIHAQTLLPDACLKSLVRQCEVDAEGGFLDGASAATCSLRYEALLRHGFRGDFHSFLRWWQNAPRVAAQ